MKLRILIIMVCIFCMVACQKKEQTAIREPEVQPLEIELPETAWQKTACIITEDTGAVSRIITESIARRLDPEGLRIVTGSEITAGADYVVKTRAAQHNDTIEISYVIQESGRDSTFHHVMSFGKEEILAALESVSAQVSQSLGDSSFRKQSHPGFTGLQNYTLVAP